MYEVYYQDKIVSFTSTPHSGCEILLVLGYHEIISPAKIIENLENSKHLCIKAEDPKKAFNDFCSQFVMVEAAGGVVESENGKTLMILRRGVWDLPKGHVEPGERPEQGAVREVMEETGLNNLLTKGFITSTLHFYQMNDRWEMKRTYWYLMSSGDADLVPQSEEGIAEAVWLPPGKVRQNARNTYSSIKKVLRAAEKI